MLNAIRKRLDQDEEGFTLIELMVVVLIIGILIAIAVPAFLGARERANDRAAQSDLRSALSAQQTFFSDGQVYADFGTTANPGIEAVEPNLAFHATDSAEGIVVNLGTDGAAVCMERASASGTVFAIFAGRTAGTFYGNDGCGTVTDAAPTTNGFVQGGFPS